MSATARSTDTVRPEVPPKVDVLGVRVTRTTMGELIDLIDRSVAASSRLDVTFVNPNYLMAARRDRSLLGLLNAFDVMLADGWGVVWASRILGDPLPERLANDDIEGPLFRLTDRRRLRVFLFGSAPGVAEAAATRLSASFPGISIVGTQHGWLDVERGHPGTIDPADSDRVVEAIDRARPDVLIVGLPTPLQQRWVRAHRPRLDVPVVITGGSYLDHVAERIGWYPEWVVAAHLCWAYRLAREPRRLWRRYSLELAEFGARVAAEAVRRRGAGRIARSARAWGAWTRATAGRIRARRRSTRTRASSRTSPTA
jgi:N-acetylglucosaminyldiphosphoundecaprenol N-acetyl-beta-D-mannosaminyltransferase